MSPLERENSIALILKRASASRPSAESNDDDYDVLADGAVVGGVFKANAAPVGVVDVGARLRSARRPHADAGYEPTREAAMAAFAKSWRRE